MVPQFYHTYLFPNDGDNIELVPFRLISGTLILVILSLLIIPSFLLFLRRKARINLENANLPTVLWTPRFFNYTLQEEEEEADDDDCTEINKTNRRKKLASSNITGILPRMERMEGPYGMYGTVYGISTRVVHIAHPIPAKAILCNKLSGSLKRPAYDHFKNFSGNGVFTADGDEWREKRASVIHCLLRRSMTGERLESEANRAANTFMKEVEEKRRMQGGQEVELNVVPILQRSTIGLIYRYLTHQETLFDNIDYNLNEKVQPTSVGKTPRITQSKSDCGKNCDSEMPTPSTSSLTSCSKPLLLTSYLKSVTRIRMIILAQSRSFWFLLPRFLYTNLSSMFKDEEEAMSPIRQFAKRAINNALPGSPLALLQNRESHNGKGKCMSTVPSVSKNGIIEKNTISKAIVDEAITLLFAGQDTSAATLSWTLHLLSLHPDVNKKVADEIRTVMNKCREKRDKQNTVPLTSDKNELELSKSVTSQMKYLDAVIKESMRLYPVAPFVVRKLSHDISIPDTQTTLPKGAFACIWIYGLHRNKLLWNEPDKFIPERWLDPNLQKLDPGQLSGAFMPFATGPRNCLGQSLANVILRIMLARIMNEYEVLDKRLDQGKDANDLKKDMQAGFTVLPVGGVRLTLRKRSQPLVECESKQVSHNVS